MKILVTNDDGMFADGLWRLARELRQHGEVAVVAPDREQSAIGTAITLIQPLRVQKIRSPLKGVESFAVQGTPGDSVILALEKLVGKVDIVVSGINEGPNVGSDVIISGTVGAALQGYLRGFPSIALSLKGNQPQHIANAAKIGSLIVRKMLSASLRAPVLLNVNVPDLDLNQIRGVRITSLASESHVDTAQEGHDGKRSYYWLVRKRRSDRSHAPGSDILALDQGYVSITSLRIYGGGMASDQAEGFCTEQLCNDLYASLAE